MTTTAFKNAYTSLSKMQQNMLDNSKASFDNNYSVVESNGRFAVFFNPCQKWFDGFSGCENILQAELHNNEESAWEYAIFQHLD